MRKIELSDHLDTRLRDIRRQRRAAAEQAQAEHQNALAHHRARVRQLRDQRDQARAQRRWWAWLRGALAVRHERKMAPAPPVIASAPTREEEVLIAGKAGEQAATTELSRAFDDEWVLLRGYCNHRGEIDGVLLGPGGLFAIEVKYKNAKIHVDGDNWRSDRYDNYGNFKGSEPFIDGGGRSPSVQLNEPASELERVLRGHGQPVTVKRIVVFTHAKSQLASAKNLTVAVAPNPGAMVHYIKTAPAPLGVEQRAQVEELIVGDHRRHEARRSAR